MINTGNVGNILGCRLWVYAVMFYWEGYWYVKFGDHRDEKEEDAIAYAFNATFGKIKGLQKMDQLIFCEDVTLKALEYNPDYIYAPDKCKHFDNLIRFMMPGKCVWLTNDTGGQSHELHKHLEKNKDEIKALWLDSFSLWKTGKLPVLPFYTARHWYEEQDAKLENYSIKKYLSGVTTGGGKEAGSLSSVIKLHDTRDINEDTIHAFVATIPSTISEALKELAQCSGMKLSNGEFRDFSRIKAYCTKSFKREYFETLSNKTKIWFTKNMTVVNTIREIPKHYNKEIIPVLFGSFIDIGLKEADGTTSQRYVDLNTRIGVLVIAEGHNFLGKVANKLWKRIREKYNYIFLMVISGTPYDYIYNPSGVLHFFPAERTLFLRNDLYELKAFNKIHGIPEYQNFPDFNFYAIFETLINIMKADPRWQNDANGFTWKKFVSVNEKGEFIYEQLLIMFFKRLFSIDDYTGLPDRLSIHSAPELCKEAKRHIIVALPVGDKKHGSSNYIPALVKMLKTNKALGNFEDLTAYEDDLGQIKEYIKVNATPSITFTCRKLLTGTDIPAWGSLFILRPIGDSIKLFEQITGRLSRPFEGKNNVGVFLGEMENVLHINIALDEKLSIERGENKSFSYIKKRMYELYNYYGVDAGVYKKITFPDFESILEECHLRNDYRLNCCLNKLFFPGNFNYKFSQSKGVKENVEVTGDGTKAKDSYIETKHTQLVFQFKDKSEAEQEKMFREMVKLHIQKMLLICVTHHFETIQECAAFIETAIKENNTEVLSLIGLGVEYVPEYINDPEQIDITFINQWISQITYSDDIGLKGFEKRSIKLLGFVNMGIDVFDTETLFIKELKLLKNIHKSNHIMIYDKDGSVTMNVLKEIGYENRHKLIILVNNTSSADIIKFRFGKDSVNILCIDDDHVNEILNVFKHYTNKTKTLSKLIIPDFIYNLYKYLDMIDTFIGNPAFKKGKDHNFYVKYYELVSYFSRKGAEFLFVSPNRFCLRGHKACKKLTELFNPIYVIHKTDEFPEIGTAIGIFYAINESYAGKTTVLFNNDEVGVFDITKLPTSVWSNDLIDKEISDIFFSHVPKLKFEKQNNEGIFISRQMKRYDPNKKGGTHVLNVMNTDAKGYNDGQWLNIPKNQHEIAAWYLSKSLLMRYIGILYSAMNTYPFIWELLPAIDFSKNWDDETLFEYFKLNSKYKNRVKDVVSGKNNIYINEENDNE